MTDDAGRLAAFRAAAIAAAESTFEQFRDQPESDFYQAPGRTPEETWHEVRDRVGLVTARGRRARVGRRRADTGDRP